MRRIFGFIMAISFGFVFASSALAGKLEDELIEASHKGDVNSVRTLISKGADVNAKNSNGDTALEWAAVYGNADIARLLIDKGADVNARNKTGDTPLDYACVQYTDFVRLLKEAGAKGTPHHCEPIVVVRELENELVKASYTGDANSVRALITKGADVNGKNYDGDTALRRAALEGHADIVRILLDKGADINAKDIDGSTALRLASFHGRADVVRILLDKGADLDAKDNIGETALMIAAFIGKTDIVRLLIDKGADVNARNKRGNTALDYAWAKDTDVVRLLKAAGAKGTPKTR